MKKFYEKVCKLEELIALILVAGIAVLVFVSALMRTIGHPLNWAQDVNLVKKLTVLSYLKQTAKS